MSDHPFSAFKALVFAVSVLLPSSLFARPEADKPSVMPSGNVARSNAVAFDAEDLRQGRFTYQLSVKGEDIGRATIEIRSTAAGEYTITFESKDVDQTWRSRLDRSFSPKMATLEMARGQDPYRMTITYTVDGATGVETVDGSARPFAATFDEQVVDQRVDWAAMMAANFPDGGPIAFHVFDPSSSVSRLVGRRMDSTPVDGPFAMLPVVRLDYTIHKGSHAELYSVHASRDRPRMMLREDMPGDLVSVLVAVED